ncbi:MAG: DUF1552 domain-containing protein [Deltaproteobacteria bacterium]|nr:DUF1552 domain-containing protein [Deltaproteobacteria bacterium]
MSQRIDRRRFLLGSGGAMLALPMLEYFAPRTAFGAAAPPPKRFVLLVHSHGRLTGNGRGSPRQDEWVPAAAGALPAGAPSPMLAALAPIRDQIVIVDGVDNIVRHATGHGDGHYSAERTCLTAMRQKADGSGGGPSIDYVVGTRIRPNASARTSVVIPASVAQAEWSYDAHHFFGSGGSSPTRISVDPKKAITELFGPPVVAGPPPALILHDRLVARRASILDDVAGSFTALRGKVNAADRARLDAHAEFIRSLETRYAGGAGGGVTAQGYVRPSEAAVFDYKSTSYSRGRVDEQTVPSQIENLVMALAGDVVRSASLHFYIGYDPVFPSEFSPATSPFEAGNFHAMIHDTPQVTLPNAPSLRKAFNFYARMFTRLVQRLGEVTDTDGSKLIDNTLVLWVSDMGYGAAHHDFNIPVVMAGMPNAFPKGRGRAVFHDRRTLGDLYAHVLRIFGGSDTTFGEVGTLGSVTGRADTGNDGFYSGWSGYDNYIGWGTPLHRGAIDL